MSESTTETFHAGVNDPSPVRRILALGWQDGPTHGLLRLGESGPEYEFRTLEERSDPDGADVRVCGLYPLPIGSFARLANALSKYQEPRIPIWSPIWNFPSQEIERDMNALVDEILAQGGQLMWVVATEAGCFETVNVLPIVSRAAS